MGSSWSEHAKMINTIVSSVLDKHGIRGALRLEFRNYALRLFKIAKSCKREERDAMIKALKAWYKTKLVIDPEEIMKVLDEITKAITEYVEKEANR
jgi:uncharacterized protein YjgD (DUF1641 family)